MEKAEIWLDFVMEEDMEFYEKFLKELTDEELAEFLEENPDFLRDQVLHSAIIVV